MVTAEISQDLTISKSFFESLSQLPDGDRFRKCIQCGTCGGVCPFGFWMEYSPRKMIAALRADLFERVLESDTVWMCVSCNACTDFCPQQIPLATGLMRRVKEELLLAGNVPSELQTALENSQRYGNPMGESPRKRGDWAKGVNPEIKVLSQEKSPVDVLWYVGDFSSYHPSVKETTIALAKVLNALKINFGILGSEEMSDGDSQRLAGESGLFELLAEKNGKSFSKYEFQEIITTDPHAYNAIKNVYPSLGISYPVRHYTEFLIEHLDQLKSLMKNEILAFVTYHDPCYLGRVNGIYDQPRELLKAIPGVVMVEMSHNYANSLCCGGGGGGMWLDGFQWEKSEQRLSDWRIDEAVAAGPIRDFITVLEEQSKPKRKSRKKPPPEPELRILAVACPYEKPRFEDATKTVEKGKAVQVKDISELLVESMEL